MEISKIRCLKPGVSQEEAVRAFRPGGFFSFYRQIRQGALVRVADAYVPFRLYQVNYQFGRATHTRLFAMDDVDGSLDLFEFPRAPESEGIEEIKTRNYLRAGLDAAQGESLLRGKVLRIVFQQGIFKMRDPNLAIARDAEVFFIPNWLGFYGKDGALRCRVMDAVRRRMEGAKASAFFEQWLSA
ncbi:MAG: hypothetical protein NVS9B13_08830 [Candidatus Acidiferrum sp.]